MSEEQRPERDISRLEELRALLLPLGAAAGLALLLAAVSVLVAGLAGSGPVGDPGPRPAPPALATATAIPAVAGSLCSPPQDPATLPWPVSSVALAHDATSSERILRGPGDPETGPHFHIRAQTSIEPVEGSRWVTLAEREVAVYSEPLSDEARAWWREGDERELCPYVIVALRWADQPSGERERILLEIVATIPPLDTFPLSRVTVPDRVTSPTAPFPPVPTGPPLPTGTYTVWLVEVASALARTIFEVPGETWSWSPIFFGGFDGSDVVLGYHAAIAPQSDVRQLRFDLDGTQTHDGEWTGLPGRSGSVCRDPRAEGEEGPVEVDGRPYEGASCGSISPDGRWMTYAVYTTQESARTILWDQWAVDLQSGERFVLRKDLEDCGGCGGIFGPTWSPSGRYLYFTDLIWDGWFHLSDLQERTTRDIFAGPSGFYEPSWSPRGDVLLYRRSAETVLEDLEAGTELVLAGMSWPAAFDPTGRYVYSPAWVGQPSGGTTAIFDVAAAQLVATLPGRNPGTTMPHFVHFTPAVTGTDEGFVAALLGAPGCDGTAIYRDAELITCIVFGTRAELSPAGSTVVLVRMIIGESQLGEALLIDTVTGAQTRLMELVVSEWHGITPSFAWSASGMHLLVWGLSPRAQ